MKKKIATILCALFISGLSAVQFSSCDSDTNSYLNITVYDGSGSRPLPGTNLEVFAEGGNIPTQRGTSDAQGQYNVNFAAPAIVTIKAKYIVEVNDTLSIRKYRQCKSSARLKEGEVIEIGINMPTNVETENI